MPEDKPKRTRRKYIEKIRNNNGQSLNFFVEGNFITVDFNDTNDPSNGCNYTFSATHPNDWINAVKLVNNYRTYIQHNSIPANKEEN